MIGLSRKQRESLGFDWFLDQAAPRSPYGREALRRLIPFGPGKEEALLEELDNLEKTIRVRPQLEKEFTRLGQLFGQLKDIRRTFDLCEGETLGEVELFELKRFLLQSREMEALFGQINARAGYIGVEWQKTGDALKLLDPEESGVASFHVSGRYSEALTRIRREKRELEEQIRTLPNGGEREALLLERSRLAAEEEKEAGQVRQWLSEELRPYLPYLRGNVAVISRLDLLMAKAELAVRFDGCKPEIGGNTIELREMVHPRIDARLREKGQVFTRLSLTAGSGVTVITGANMGGKSVVLKTAALNVLLVHCGFYPLAKQVRVPLFDSMHLVSEDLEAEDRGLSSFGGEIVRLGEVLSAVEEGFAFVLLDEFARGTNPAEGAAIAAGAAEYLNGKNAVTLMATHYDGVAECAGAHYQVAGLRDADLSALARELGECAGMEGVAHIARQMNYGIYQVTGPEAIPRDAFHICQFLGLDKELLQIIKKRIDKS